MLTNVRGNRLWIMDETGEATPVRRHQDIHQRPRGRNLPDWWVVEKAPDWRPPARTGGGGSLLRLGMTQNEDDANRSARRWPGEEPEGAPGGSGGGSDFGPGGPARGMKIGAGHKSQAYDALGRYTGPRGGSMPMGGGKVRLFGAEGLAGEPGGQAPEEPGADLEAAAEAAAKALKQAEEQSRQAAEEAARAAQQAAEASAQTLPGVLVADSGRVVSDAGGGLSGGYEVRGPVTGPEKQAFPPPPPAPREPHLTYSQKSGELVGPDGKALATGYAGRGGGMNNPNAEGAKGVGPIPQGNWRMERLDKEACEKKGWPDPAYKLTPDAETRQRVEALGRDPDSFYVHAKAIRPEDRGNGDSKGCIALDKPERLRLKEYEGKWIRVAR